MNPQRKCIGCGKIKDKDLLLRIAAEDGIAILDKDKVLPGRGCYLCDDVLCFEKAQKKNAFRRALKKDVSIEALGRCLNDR